MSEAYAEDLGQEDMDEAPAAEDTRAKPYVLEAIGNPNLAFDLEESVLNRIGEKVVEEYTIDLESRKAEGYDERIDTALKLAKLAKEAKNYPWPNAANVKYPLIIQAAIQFNARAYPAVIDGPSVVKGKPLGKVDEVKRDRAERIGRHMSWQLLEEEDEWEEDTDQLLLRLAILGTLVRKRYFDPVKGRQCSHVIGPDRFVVNYWAQDLTICPRATQELTFYPHEVLEKERAGLWEKVDLGVVPGAEQDEQAPHCFLEQHRLWDLDEDGYPEPYIVTVHKETRKVVRIVARWYEEGVKLNDAGEVVCIEPYQCFTKYGFIPSPDGSWYDIGFGTLLGPLSETINGTINQLMDAGHLSNVQGGFIGSGVSLKSGAVRFQPGEWKRVDTAGTELAKSIVPLPTTPPSTVLFSLMQFLVDASKDLTATQDIMAGDTGKANMPVGTTLALIEQGLKTFSAIVKRIHRALRRELGIMYQLNARYLPPEVYFTFQDEEQAVSIQDYAEGDIDVVPVSDPNMATDMQKMGRAQFLMQFAGVPGFDPVKIAERVMEAASIPDIDDLKAEQQNGPPPELMVEMAKLNLEDRKVKVQERESEANIANAVADAQKKAVEAFLALPEFQLQIAQLAGQIASQMTQTTQEAPNGAVQPPDLGGMEAPPAEPAVPPVPEGPAGGVGPEMGLGGEPGPGVPGPGDVDGGIGGPGVA